MSEVGDPLLYLTAVSQFPDSLTQSFRLRIRLCGPPSFPPTHPSPSPILQPTFPSLCLSAFPSPSSRLNPQEPQTHPLHHLPSRLSSLRLFTRSSFRFSKAYVFGGCVSYFGGSWFAFWLLVLCGFCFGLGLDVVVTRCLARLVSRAPVPSQCSLLSYILFPFLFLSPSASHLPPQSPISFPTHSTHPSPSPSHLLPPPGPSLPPTNPTFLF